MKLSLSLNLILILCFFNLSFANDGFQEKFKNAWTKDYTPLACSDNVLKLYKRFDKPKEAYVIHIFHKNVPHESISPLHARKRTGKAKQAPKQRWVFHAVLYTNELIYDLDYTNTPTPVAFDKYFGSMWKKSDLSKNFRFQIKPANLYNSYDTDGTMNSEPIKKFRDLEQVIMSRFISQLSYHTN